ncbi:MAG: GH1 family beta-glucosidase [Phycisphaerales bacterium]
MHHTPTANTAFPPDFLWGAAAASYQIEGGSTPDLRGESVWDAFCRRPGAVHQGHDGTTACDHYRLFREDIGLMHAMGLRAYRFSIAWPRVLPTGEGTPNAAGLDFYDRLVDCLLEHRIQPWATLFHWDFPLDLFRRGGWLNRDSARWFADYTSLVVRRLSDRVSSWMTINEPQVFLQLGHGDGTHAPGLKLPFSEQLVAAHNVLRAHGLSALAIRANAATKPVVGWAPVGHVQFPADSRPETVEVARRGTFAIANKNLWTNTWFADPVCRGHYPEDGLALFGKDVPTFPSSDMTDIRQPLDFYGVNIYTGGPVVERDGAAVPVPAAPGAPRTAFNWTIEPQSLHWGPRFINERYGLPVYITENGMSSHDWIDSHGRCLDTARIDYTRRYLLALREAVHAGADIRGYFHWSILDNFEWAEGYKERFGMIHVDFATLKRTPKLSAHWYASVVRSGGLALSQRTDLSPESQFMRPLAVESKPEPRPESSPRTRTSVP